MFGRTGKILFVDLGSRTHEAIVPDGDLYSRFVGGRGLGGHYLAESMSLDWDHPDTPFIFMAGPLTGAAIPGCDILSVLARSPLTGTPFDESVAGEFGPRLKRAGWDGLILSGRSGEPVGLEIRDGEVTFHNAVGLSRLGTREIMERCRGMGSVAFPGLAAEHGVRFASLLVDGGPGAARGGLGLSLQAKGVKFVAVDGSGIFQAADPAGCGRAVEDIRRLLAASPALLGEYGFSRWGTGALFDPVSCRRMIPTDNFRATWFAHALQCNAPTFAKIYSPRPFGCANCPVKCGRVAQNGAFLPEYEAMSHWTALINNLDPRTAFEAVALCLELGLDPVSTAAVLACRMEITGEEYTQDRIMSLISDIAHARGEGAELAAGSLGFARARGREETSMTVKGLELPAYDPRGAYGLALGYAVSTRGGDHARAGAVGHEVLRKPVGTDRFTFSGKARIVKIGEDAAAAADCLCVCKLMFLAASLEEYAAALQAVTGQPVSAQELLRAGERTVYLERVMNAEAGFTAGDDDLPSRFFEEEGSGGDGFHVPALDREAFLAARSAYYLVRGLDPQGRPLAETCAELELPCAGF